MKAIKLYSLKWLKKKKQRKKNLLLLVSIFIVSLIVYPHPFLAMWFTFMLAAYSAIANDSIQTIGTFISSNNHIKWYYLWIFMGLIFVATVSYSWIVFDGDVTHQRLNVPGLDKAPTSFSFLQVIAPTILLILTKMKMPISTSILLLSAFATKTSSIESIIKKSVFGYLLAFVFAIIIWVLITKLYEKYKSKEPSKIWLILQWITSGFLWAVWIMQDASNIAVVLPRQLEFNEFLFFTTFIFFGLGILFYLKGGEIQSIITEKTDVQDIRSATMIDFAYLILLYYLKIESNIPISTTWVFIGLIGGRELAIGFHQKKTHKRFIKVQKSIRLLSKDFWRASVGLIVSLILALSINEEMYKQFLKIIKSFF